MTDRMIPRLIEILDQHINTVDEKMSQLASLRKDITDYRRKMITRLKAAAAEE